MNTSSESASNAPGAAPINPTELTRVVLDPSRIDADVALIQRVLDEEDVGPHQMQSSADAYAQELDYVLEQLGGAARAYDLFLGSPFREQGLPSRRLQPNSEKMFTIFDLPVLKQLRAAYPRAKRSHAALYVAEVSGRAVQRQLGQVADTMLAAEVKEPRDLARVLVASALQGIASL